MPYDGSAPEIELDFDILEAVGRLYESLSEGLRRTGAPMTIVRRWLLGHAEVPDDVEDQITLMAMALDLEVFTPSPSGRTAVDRYLATLRPETQLERRAASALGAAQFRLVRVVELGDPDLVRLTDLVTQEDLVLLNSRISPFAAGAATAMRLCPLESGRQVLISPLFLLDETMLAAAMAFVRPGKRLGNGHRCAASLYRDAARHGFIPMPKLDRDSFAEPIVEAYEPLREPTEIEHLANRWVLTGGVEDRVRLTTEIRGAASLDNLVDAIGCLADATATGQRELVEAFTAIAEIHVETLARRADAGVDGHDGILDRAAEDVAGHITAGRMHSRAADLFHRIRARLSLAHPASGSADRAALDKLIQRIMALRAKTIGQGCTEPEALSAAAKVAELLERHDLTLDEVSVRNADCAGAAVETGRRRRAPVDDCVQPVATFCDCKAWSEETDAGALRYIFFGLKADVEAARFLQELIEKAFHTETEGFRLSETYLARRGGERRAATHAFQLGLGRGIIQKLRALKDARLASASTGFDLVEVKHGVVDDEVEKLGLRFTTKTHSSHRLVDGDAYDAGQAAGALFEPHRSLSV